MNSNRKRACDVARQVRTSDYLAMYGHKRIVCSGIDDLLRYRIPRHEAEAMVRDGRATIVKPSWHDKPALRPYIDPRVARRMH